MSVFNSASFDHHELVVFKEDPRSGLKAIIAVHNSTLGPSMGGCRMFPYSDDSEALEDVLRLSRGMTYKSALAGIPVGGGKSVIIGDPHRQKSTALLLAMGDFVESLAGRYIIAEDSGTSVQDIEIIAQRTGYISGLQHDTQHGGDPSPTTAYGVYLGIEAAIKYRCGQNAGVDGLRVAIQGAGNVGRHLAKHLMQNGAIVTVADINKHNLALAQALGAEVVSVAEIITTQVDVLAPCAMGAIINDNNVKDIKAAIVAGAANNQLARPEHAQILRDRGILYAPDFVANAGGIIDVHYQRVGGEEREMQQKVEKIAETLNTIFTHADEENLTTHQVAEKMAEEIFIGKNQRAV